MASGSESSKQEPTGPESESPKQEPKGPGPESPKQEPAGPGSESPMQEPKGPGSESTKQEPTGIGSESPKQKPTGPGSESTKQEPTGPGSESTKQEPTGPGSESTKQEPTGNGSESTKQEPTGNGSESPKQKPTGTGSESPKQEPTGTGSESPKQNPTSSGSESPKQNPTSSGSESLKQNPTGPDSESLKRKFTGPGSESLKRKFTGPGSQPMRGNPTGPGSLSMRGNPNGPGSRPMRGYPTGPGCRPMRGYPTGPGFRPMRGSPTGPGSRPMRGYPTGPGCRPMRGYPTGPGCRPMRGNPTGPGCRPMRGNPTGPGSLPMRGSPTGPGSRPMRGSPTGPGSRPMRGNSTGPGSQPMRRNPTGPGSESTKQKPTGSRPQSLTRKPTGPTNYNDDVWKLTKGTVDKKLEKSEPYRIFMSPISCDPGTHTEESTLSFAELLDKSLGDLTESLHLNFMVELGWLFAQYFITDQRGKRMTLIYERCDEDIDKLHKEKKLLNVRHKKIINKNAFGHHHSKVSMFAYADGSLRVVVMSANLCEDDWTKYAQGIWVSPKFPSLREEDNKSDGNSKTDFKLDILRYLISFREPSLFSWIKKIEKVDFSEANVFFIPSVPGKHKEPMWGHLYLKNILKKHACLPIRVPSEWPIIAQCSSLGSLGATDEEWLKSEFIESLSASTYAGDTDTDHDPVPFNLIYPSKNNVLNSWDGALGGICLPYNKNVHEKQLWLRNYMCLWKCHSRKRSKAMPHIKTYCRISSCCTEMSWFLLTSANLSKAAWGRKLKSDEQCTVTMAHEAGVLFLPKFLIGTETFPIDETETSICPYFSLPFDLPLSEYSDTDQPWTISL